VSTRMRNNDVWMAVLVAVIMLAFILVLLIGIKGCTGIEVERPAEFREAGVIYQTEGGTHELYGGANGDLVLNVGTFEFGASERFRVSEEGISSTTEFLLRLYETLGEEVERVPAEYLVIRVSLVIDSITGEQEACFSVEGNVTFEPVCQDLPWLDETPPIVVEGVLEAN